MMNAALLVQGRHRLGADRLASACAQRLEGRVGLDRAQRGFHHLAAIVHLGDDAVALVAPERRDRAGRPIARAVTAREIVQHIGGVVGPEPRDDDAGFGRSRPRARRRVDRHHHAAEMWRLVDPSRLDHGAGPERAQSVFQQLGFEFLAPEPRAQISLHHRIQERRRQIGAVLEGRTARDDDALLRQKIAQELHRLGRGGRDRARVRPEAQPQHQIVPGLSVAPRCELVAPGEIVLRAPEPLGLVGGKTCGDRAVGPDDAVARRLVMRAFLVAR